MSAAVVYLTCVATVAWVLCPCGVQSMPAVISGVVAPKLLVPHMDNQTYWTLREQLMLEDHSNFIGKESIGSFSHQKIF